MICEVCRKNQASFQRLVPHLGKTVPVCIACLSKISTQGKMNLSGFGGSANFDLIKEALLDFEPEFVDYFSEKQRGVVHNIVCANCGFEFNGYFETGRLGCSKCYDAFKSQIIPIVQEIHGTVKHNGSRPTARGGR